MRASSPLRVPVWPSFAVLLLAGLYLGVRWADIPAQWIIHWGAGGVPNGWATRTWVGVYGPLLMGAAVIVFIEIVSRSVRAREAQGRATEEIVRATIAITRLVGLAIALLFGFLAVTLPLGPHVPPGIIVLGTLGLLLGAVALGSRGASRAVKEARAQDPQRFEGYHGLYYANRNDTRLWVPKMMGVGWTINFAHPWAWPVMVLLLGVPLGFAVGSLLLTTR